MGTFKFSRQQKKKKKRAKIEDKSSFWVDLPYKSYLLSMCAYVPQEYKSFNPGGDCRD